MNIIYWSVGSSIRRGWGKAGDRQVFVGYRGTYSLHMVPASISLYFRSKVRAEEPWQQCDQAKDWWQSQRVPRNNHQAQMPSQVFQQVSIIIWTDGHTAALD